MTSSPSSIVSQVDYTDLENTRICSKKIKIYPEAQLKKIWKQWIAASRRCYNLAIDFLRNSVRLINVFQLEKIIVNDPELPEWLKSVPRAIKVNAVKDAHSAFKKSLASGTKRSEAGKFRSCHDQQQTIKFKNENFSKGAWYPRLTRGLSFKTSLPIPQNCQHGTQLTKIKNQWYGVFPETKPVINNQQKGVFWSDPGVRCFITGFDTTRFVEFGKGDFGRITRLCSYLDKLNSSMTKVNSKCRRKMRLAAFRIRQKIRNLIDEAHKQIACYLTNNYRLIFIPTFESSQMVSRSTRKIKSKTARAMLTWSHYRFKQTLKHQASLRGCNVIETSEAYSSKTCVKCGQIHQKLGGNKNFKCPKCHHEISRDFNGVLGIFLRTLSDTTLFVEQAIASLMKGNVQQCSA